MEDRGRGGLLMPVLDTGWVYISSNGQKTQVVVPEGKVISARVRWKGRQRTVTNTTTTSDSDSGSGGSTFNSKSMIPSSPGGGWSLTRVSCAASMSGASSGSWDVACNAGGTGSANSGTGTSGSHTHTNWSPGYTNSSANGNFHGINITGWSASATAYWESSTTYQTQNPKITVNGKETSFTGTLNHGVESAWYDCPADSFLPGVSNEVTHNIAGSNRADVQIEVTYAPALTGVHVAPEAYGRMVPSGVYLEIAHQDPDPLISPTAWFPAVRIGQDPDMVTYDEYDSKTSQSRWTYDGGGTWEALTAVGAPIGARCRYSIDGDLLVGRWYWRVRAWDDDTELWGAWSTNWQFRVVLSLDARYALDIGGVDFSGRAINIRVSETTNGELGSMEFELVVDESELPSDGDYTILAVRDAAGNEEQYEGWMQGNPERVGPYHFACFVKLPDSILAERYVLADYASQDVGLTFQEIVDTYCEPLDSAGVNAATGFERPVDALGKTALDVAKELREQYGLVFWVRSTDSVVFLVKPEDLDAPTALIVRGQVG